MSSSKLLRGLPVLFSKEGVAEGMTRRDQKGMALVLAIMLLLVLFVMGSTLLMLATTDIKIATHQMRDNKALFVADAGIQEVLTRITSDSSYVGDTVEFVRPDWQSEIYAVGPPAGAGDTLRFLTLPGCSVLNYADPTAPVMVHYLKNRDGDVVYYDPDTKERVTDTPLPLGVVPIHVAEATGTAHGGVYPVRRKAITEFIVSTLDYEVFDYALHTGGDIYFRAISSSEAGRLSTFSAFSDVISILRDNDGDTIYIDMDGSESYDRGREVNFFGGEWNPPSDYDLMQMRNVFTGYPPPHTPPPDPDLSTLDSTGWIFANGDITFDEVDIFIPKFSDTWLTGTLVEYHPSDTTYILRGGNQGEEPFPVPLINMSPDYWKYHGAEIVDRLDIESIPDGWSWDSLGYHWDYAGDFTSMTSGIYFFSDDNVIIDSIFDPAGDVKIITPFSIYISNDVTYEHEDAKAIAFLAGEDVGVGGDMANVIVKALLYAKKGDLTISKQAVILGAVIIRGDAEISGECAIILDKRLNGVFEFVEPEKKYVSTVLSWREVRP